MIIGVAQWHAVLPYSQLLKQARTGRWFLRIASVCKCLYPCLCVCPPPRLLITSGMIQILYDQLNKFYGFGFVWQLQSVLSVGMTLASLWVLKIGCIMLIHRNYLRLICVATCISTICMPTFKTEVLSVFLLNYSCFK